MNYFKASMKRLAKKLIKWPPSPLMRAILDLGLEAWIWLLAFNSRSAFKKLAKSTQLRLNLGCGTDLRTDWVNIDLLPPPNRRQHQDVLYISHDLRRGVPLKENSCMYIYSSHFWEHLDAQEGLQLLKDCYRCLQPNGVFRIVLPDYARAFDAYMRHDIEFFGAIPQDALGIDPDLMTITDYVQYFIYQHGEHKRFYDLEKLRKLFEFLGYQEVEASSFQSGIDIDTDLRRAYSFYVEARK